MNEVRIKRAGNGWIIAGSGEEGEDVQVYQVYEADDSIPKSEKQQEQDALTFIDVLNSLVEKLEVLPEESAHKIEIKLVPKKKAK